MFDEAYVEPERTEVLVAPVNPAQPVELHYMHAGDAGADLVTTAHVELGPFQRALVPTGVRIALPAGYVGLVHPRSGLAVKQGVTVLNAPGTIDAGYRGEIKVPLINLDPEHTAVFEPGDRIAQLVIQRYVQAEFIEASVLPGSDRAERGFGSSGVCRAHPCLFTHGCAMCISEAKRLISNPYRRRARRVESDERA